MDRGREQHLNPKETPSNSGCGTVFICEAAGCRLGDVPQLGDLSGQSTADSSQRTVSIAATKPSESELTFFADGLCLVQKMILGETNQSSGSCQKGHEEEETHHEEVEIVGDNGLFKSRQQKKQGVTNGEDGSPPKPLDFIST